VGGMTLDKYLKNFIEVIYQKYIGQNLPCKFKLEDIHKIMKDKYSAVEEDIMFADIGEDVENPCRYYVITETNVLKNLFTDEEKIDLYTMGSLLKNEPIENKKEKMWLDVQVGRRINIILTSEDNEYISGFTLQGMSEKLFNELCIFEGIDNSKCQLGNEEFHEYLKRLVKADYIK
jgi:hypothetical protein